MAIVKVVKVGEVFKANTVRKGSNAKGEDYHFVAINLKEGTWKDGKEQIDKVTIFPIESQVDEGEYLKITEIISVSKSSSKYKDKWYDNVNVEARFVKAADSEVPSNDESFNSDLPPLTDQDLPF